MIASADARGTSTTRHRVMVADDDPEIRAALVEVFSAEPTLELIGVAADAESAIELACDSLPDVALIDVKMPGGGGLRASREIMACSPSTRIVVLSAYEDRSTVLEMLRAGAVGYLVKGSSPEKIVEAVERAALGQSSVSHEVMGDVVKELSMHLKREGKRADEALERSQRIERVLATQDILMVFQPIVRLEGRAWVGAEALARFAVAPQRPPNHWFEEAAAVGLGTELELLAIRLAIAGASALPDGLYLTLNLSPRAVLSGSILASLGSFPLSRVVVEITEHEMIEDYEELDQALAPLRAQSVRVAIDDAGAGFASLRHTLLLAPDIIKIDSSITREINQDRGRRALASALVSFAAEMDMTVIAEGVETEAEVETLMDLGVELGQGVLLGRPRVLDPA